MRLRANWFGNTFSQIDKTRFIKVDVNFYCQILCLVTLIDNAKIEKFIVSAKRKINISPKYLCIGVIFRGVIYGT